MSKHTERPWICVPSGPVMRGYSLPFAIGQEGHPNLIGGAFGDVRGGEDVARANGYLMAAAPDLLEACRLALGRYMSQFGVRSGGETGAEREIIRRAIAKAEGTP